MRSGSRLPALPALLLVAVLSGLHAGAGARAEDEGLEAAQGAIDRARMGLEANVRALLLSADDRKVCWGATYARELSLDALVPELAEILRRYDRDPEGVSFRTLYAAFDALLHLEARLDVEDLLPFTQRGRRGRAAAVALAIRGGNPHVVLAMFDAYDRDGESWNKAWLALGNALAEESAPGFFRRVFEGVDVQLAVTVTDGDRLGGVGGSRTVGSGDGRYRPAEGYPRVWAYDLTLHPGAGDVLLSRGPRPVYLEREEVRGGFGAQSFDADRSGERLAWIADLVREAPDDLPLRRRMFAVVRWTDGAAFLDEVDGARDRVRRAFRALVDLAAARGALTPQEASSLPDPRIQVVVNDVREDTSEALPPVPGTD